MSTPPSSMTRGLRELPMLHTGKPAPFRLTAPAYLAALGGWLAAGVLLADAAPELVRLAIYDSGLVAAAHAVGLVFFPFAVAAAVWQLIPVMLRNNPPLPQLRWVVLALLTTGAPLAYGLSQDRRTLAYVAAALLAAGLLLFLAELALLIRGAPAERRLAVSRPPLAIAGLHTALAFALGVAVLVDGGPEPLGIPYERVLLIHLSLALIGWLTVMIAAVGRTLVPMLGLASAAPPRTVPVAEIALVGGLWAFVGGIAASAEALIAIGVLAMLGGLLEPARRFVRVARSGKPAAREGPVAHIAIGLAFLLEAALLALGASAGLVDDRRAAVAGVLLVGLGWAAGVIAGHLGKLISLSGWGSWPPGPRPTQAALYPRVTWQAEAVFFAAGVQLIAGGVLAESPATTRVGAVALATSAVVGLAGALETIRRVACARRASTA